MRKSPWILNNCKWHNRVWFFRKSDEEVPYVDTLFPLPTVDTEFIPLSVELRLPAFGGVKSLLPLSYIFQNRTPYPQELEVAMDTNDCFMFSGNKQVTLVKFIHNCMLKWHYFLEFLIIGYVFWWSVLNTVYIFL